MYLFKYYPYRDFDGQRNPSFDKNSGLLLDLKEGQQSALNYFYNWIDKYIQQDVTICTVPSSNSTNIDSGIRQLGRMIAANNRIDATHCLNRHTTIAKAAHGGPRNQSVHFDSISVIEDDLIVNKAILLLDDISTSKSSITACKSILLDAGASNVFMFVLGITER